MKRSKASPKAAVTAMATHMAGNTAARLSQTLADCVQSLIDPNTLVATNAPRAMNTPCPKLSTSIKPKTKVKPEAITKMIMPMAKPATVRVNQLEGEPIKGRAIKARRGTKSKGFRSSSGVFIALSLGAGVASLCRHSALAWCLHAPHDRCPSRRHGRPSVGQNSGFARPAAGSRHWP